MNDYKVLLWLLGIVFSAGSLFGTIRIYFNEVKHLQGYIKELKDVDEKQNQRIITLETDMKWIKESLIRIEKRFNGVSESR